MPGFRIIRKTTARLFIITLFITGTPLSGQEEKSRTGSEITEWSFISVLALSNYLVEKSDVWADEPLIGGATGKEYHESRVPSWWLYAGGGIAGLGIVFLPNNSGHMNSVSCRNTKGFIEAAMLTMLATGITKNAVGRKRPSYDNYPPEEEKEARRSFFSGHASASFSIATYSSLYIFQYMGKWDNAAHLAGKLISSGALLGMAVYASWSRVEDNKHYSSDVLVGGAVGVIISAAVYGFQNGLTGLTPRKNKIKEDNNVSFHFGSDGSRYRGSAVMRF